MDSQKKSQDIQQAELERKKRDLYRVFNPTNQDYQVVLNLKVMPEVWTIKTKSEEIVPAYAADKYFDEMADKIISNKSDKAVLEENEKREAKGFPKLNLHTEQPRFEGRIYKNLTAKKIKIIAILNRGLYQEYGVGEKKVQEIDKKDQRDSFESGVSLAEEPTVSPPVAPKPMVSPDTGADKPSEKPTADIPPMNPPPELPPQPPVVRPPATDEPAGKVEGGLANPQLPAETEKMKAERINRTRMKNLKKAQEAKKAKKEAKTQ